MLPYGVARSPNFFESRVVNDVDAELAVADLD
jgi:hypothetical protein